MQQVNIKFYNVEQVNQFVNAIDQFDTKFDLGSGQKIVNAKSILGVFTLDLSKPLSLRYYSKDDMIIKKITPFIYQGGEREAVRVQ